MVNNEKAQFYKTELIAILMLWKCISIGGARARARPRSIIFKAPVLVNNLLFTCLIKVTDEKMNNLFSKAEKKQDNKDRNLSL